MRRDLQLTLLLSLLLAVSPGCAQRNGPSAALTPAAPQPDPAAVQAQAHPGPRGLPRPSELPGLQGPVKKTSYVESDLIKNGADFGASLPHTNVAAQGSALAFTPGYEGSADSVDKLALAAYIFNASGYDRQAQLRTVWSSAPADPGSVWYGLANWGKDRWDWQPSPAGFKLVLPSFAPYINLTGGLVLVVLRTGSDASTLTSVRLAAPLPTAALSANPLQGAPPLPVSFDASASTAAEGTIVKYEFDKGNGVVVDKGALPGFDTTYTSAGSHLASVRVTDSLGGQATAQLTVRVIGPWTHSYSRGTSDGVNGLCIDAAGNIYACGSSGKIPGFVRGVVWKYDAFGNLLWVRATSNDANAEFRRCALDADGNLVLCGDEVLVGNILHGILQKWTPDGAQVWTRGYLAPHSAELRDVLVNGNEIYAVGDIGNAAQDTLMLAMHVSADGQLDWARSWNVGPGYSSEAYCGALRTGLGSGVLELLAAGFSGPWTDSPPDYEPAPALLGWDANGNLTRSWRIGDGSYGGYVYSLQVAGFGVQSYRFVALGSHYSGNDNQTFLFQSKLDGSGDGGVLYAKASSSCGPSDMCTVPSVTGWLSSGSVNTSTASYGSLIGLDPAGASAAPQYYWDSSDKNSTGYNAIRATSGGGVVLGGSALVTALPGTRGELSGETLPFIASWQTVSGVSSDAAITLFDTAAGSLALSDGVVDGGSGVSSALVHYEPQTN